MTSAEATAAIEALYGDRLDRIQSGIDTDTAHLEVFLESAETTGAEPYAALSALQRLHPGKAKYSLMIARLPRGHAEAEGNKYLVYIWRPAKRKLEFAEGRASHFGGPPRPQLAVSGIDTQTLAAVGAADRPAPTFRRASDFRQDVESRLLGTDFVIPRGWEVRVNSEFMVWVGPTITTGSQDWSNLLTPVRGVRVIGKYAGADADGKMIETDFLEAGIRGMKAGGRDVGAVVDARFAGEPAKAVLGRGNTGTRLLVVSDGYVLIAQTRDGAPPHGLTTENVYGVVRDMGYVGEFPQ